MKIKDKELFFAYALPCMEAWVKRGKISRKEAEELVNRYKRDKKLPPGTENLFPTALSFLKKIAREMGKDVIDKDVIREYFLKRHNEIIERMYRIKRDFDVEKCKTKKGEVIEVRESYVVVRVGDKTGNYNTFVDDLKKGEEVILHWGYVVERLSKDGKK